MPLTSGWVIHSASLAEGGTRAAKREIRTNEKNWHPVGQARQPGAVV